MDRGSQQSERIRVPSGVHCETQIPNGWKKGSDPLKAPLKGAARCLLRDANPERVDLDEHLSGLAYVYWRCVGAIVIGINENPQGFVSPRR